MKKEELKPFLEKLPFRIILKKGVVMTITEVVKLTDSILIFKDKNGYLTTQQLVDISTLQERRGGLL